MAKRKVIKRRMSGSDFEAMKDATNFGNLKAPRPKHKKTDIFAVEKSATDSAEAIHNQMGIAKAKKDWTDIKKKMYAHQDQVKKLGAAQDIENEKSKHDVRTFSLSNNPAQSLGNAEHHIKGHLAAVRKLNTARRSGSKEEKEKYQHQAKQHLNQIEKHLNQATATVDSHYLDKKDSLEGKEFGHKQRFAKSGKAGVLEKGYKSIPNSNEYNETLSSLKSAHAFHHHKIGEIAAHIIHHDKGMTPNLAVSFAQAHNKLHHPDVQAAIKDKMDSHNLGDNQRKRLNKKLGQARRAGKGMIGKAIDYAKSKFMKQESFDYIKGVGKEINLHELYGFRRVKKRSNNWSSKRTLHRKAHRKIPNALGPKANPEHTAIKQQRDLAKKKERMLKTIVNRQKFNQKIQRAKAGR